MRALLALALLGASSCLLLEDFRYGVPGSCGDGVQDEQEACDDGNTASTDGCTSACEVATCGDGFVRAGVELCDDGNSVDGDGCNTDCVPSGTLLFERSEPDVAIWNAVAVGASGEIVLAGGTRDATDPDALVRVVAADGTTAWTWQSGVAGDDTALGVAVGPSGEVFVGGRASTSATNDEAWYARLDPPGTLAYREQLPNGADVLDGGGYQLAFAGGALFLAGGLDPTMGDGLAAFCARVDPASGQVLWEATVDGPGDQRARAVAADGERVVFAITSSLAAPVLRTYDPGGALLGEHVVAQYPGPSVLNVALAPGRIVLAGDVDQEGFVASFDAASPSKLDLLAERRFQAPQFSKTRGVAVDPVDGAVLACGRQLDSSGVEDGWITRLPADLLGDAVWSHTIATPLVDGCRNLAVAPDRSVWAVGTKAVPPDEAGWFARFAP